MFNGGVCVVDAMNAQRFEAAATPIGDVPSRRHWAWVKWVSQGGRELMEIAAAWERDQRSRHGADFTKWDKPPTEEPTR